MHTSVEVSQLQVLAEVDALADRIERWADSAPSWPTCESAAALLRRLCHRAQRLRTVLHNPLVVAVLGGTGTGKSSLINALVEAEVVTSGRHRPTTDRPTVVCAPTLSLDELGIAPHAADIAQHDLPVLEHLVLVDCPDPDTTESPPSTANGEATAPNAATNLARLREILPHCDVILVVSTQQKYRSARVADELTQAAPGARLLFVQTHADRDEDIRDDWRRMLADRFAVGRMFFVDSRSPQTEEHRDEPSSVDRHGVASLRDLLVNELLGSGGTRIRRANFLELAAATLSIASRQLEASLPTVKRLRSAIDEQRQTLARPLVAQTSAAVRANRRYWEGRVLTRTAARWGASPFAWVVRGYQGLGAMISGSLLARVRTPTQAALVGTIEAARHLQRYRAEQRSQAGLVIAAESAWNRGELRDASFVIEGYATEARIEIGLDHRETLASEAEAAAEAFSQRARGDIDRVIESQADRVGRWYRRLPYEAMLLAMIVVVLTRLAKNYFWDSWWADPPVDVAGIDFYVASLFWLVAWCALLLWLFCGQVRRGLQGRLRQLAEQWQDTDPGSPLFSSLETECDAIERHVTQLDHISAQVQQARRQLALPESQLGRINIADSNA